VILAAVEPQLVKLAPRLLRSGALVLDAAEAGIGALASAFQVDIVAPHSWPPRAGARIMERLQVLRGGGAFSGTGAEEALVLSAVQAGPLLLGALRLGYEAAPLP